MGVDLKIVRRRLLLLQLLQRKSRLLRNRHRNPSRGREIALKARHPRLKKRGKALANSETSDADRSSFSERTLNAEILPPQEKEKAIAKSHQNGDLDGGSLSKRPIKVEKPPPQQMGKSLANSERSEADSASCCEGPLKAETPPSRKRGKAMAKSQTSEPQCPRTAIRDVPRRKAAPLGVGVFSEAKSPSVEKTLSLPPKKAPRKATTKKGKNCVTVKMETASLSSECELPPPKVDSPEVVCETKTHGGKHNVGGE